MKKNILKKIFFGLIPITIGSVMTPISSCVNMTNSQNQTHEEKTKQDEVTYDDLCYMRQNALVNYARLSKQSQLNIDNDLKKIEQYSDTFVNSVEKIFNDEQKSLSDRYADIIQLCYISKLNVVDYKAQVNTFKTEFDNYDPAKIDKATKNRVEKLLNYNKENYSLSSEFSKSTAKFNETIMANDTSLNTVKFLEGIKLNSIIEDSVKVNSSNSEQPNKRTNSVSDVKLYYIDTLENDNGMNWLKIGQDITDVFKIGQLAFDENKSNENYYTMPSFFGSKLEEKYDFKVKIKDFSYDDQKNYEITVVYGLIEKKYTNRLNSGNYWIWSDSKDFEENFKTASSKNGFATENDDKKVDIKFQLAMSKQKREEKINNAFEIVQKMKPYLKSSGEIGFQTYRSFNKNRQWVKFSNIEPLWDNNTLLFEKFDFEDAIRILKDFRMKYYVTGVDEASHLVSFQIKFAIYNSSVSDQCYYLPSKYIDYRFTAQTSPIADWAGIVSRKIKLVSQLENILNKKTTEEGSTDTLPYYFQYFGVESQTPATLKDDEKLDDSSKLTTIKYCLIGLLVFSSYILIVVVIYQSFFSLYQRTRTTTKGAWEIFKIVLMILDCLVAISVTAWIFHSLVVSVRKNDTAINKIQNALKDLFSLKDEADNPDPKTLENNLTYSQMETDAMKVLAKLMKDETFISFKSRLATANNKPSEEELEEYNDEVLGDYAQFTSIANEEKMLPMQAWSVLNNYIAEESNFGFVNSNANVNNFNKITNVEDYFNVWSDSGVISAIAVICVALAGEYLMLLLKYTSYTNTSGKDYQAERVRDQMYRPNLASEYQSYAEDKGGVEWVQGTGKFERFRFAKYTAPDIASPYKPSCKLLEWFVSKKAWIWCEHSTLIGVLYILLIALSVACIYVLITTVVKSVLSMNDMISVGQVQI